ncbi:hypothetical protein BCR34DRAFT_594311 [Clohesyomyces aquaticus]|uniref:F-box domain-containing protein n=1 Tax=Clohesyomyces aquaticus TaxID=1231657 RepID=A0A1Y1YA10_9PLEO|nr:hypothetical protein BCR34DRAFT_594311 [Clohesyomyces aquaticus]
MSDFSYHAGGSRCRLLTLPRELRDEIYQSVVLPQYAYTDKPFSHHNSKKPVKEYMDARIYMPARTPSNVLATCKQLRHEMLEFVTRLLNSSRPVIDHQSPPKGNVKVTNASGDYSRSDSLFEASIERAKDDGSVRITLKILVPFRGALGSYVPNRDEPSPRFIAFLPLLSRLRRIKFDVWGGWNWWFGPLKRTPEIKAQQKSRFIRTTSDQTDEIQGGQSGSDGGDAISPLLPDPLSHAIAVMTQHMPLLEDVSINIFMHARDYWNLDLPEVKYAGIEGFLSDPIRSSSNKSIRKVYRRVMVCHPFDPNWSVTAFRKSEIFEPAGDGRFCAHTSEGAGVVPDQFEETPVNLPQEPPFTKIHDRAVDANMYPPDATMRN